MLRLDDMKTFAAVVDHGSFTRAADALGLAKQTVSRRVAALEEALGVVLLHRTTRTVRPTDVGAAYARRCAEMVRIAEEANRDVVDEVDTPRGTLRVTADRTFGEAFLGDLVVEYAQRCPDVSVDVTLTRRRVDLIEERVDVAFRVGAEPDATHLSATRLGPAEVCYCAHPSYVERRGAPADPEALAEHDLVVIAGPRRSTAWPFRDTDGGLRLVPVEGRIVVDSMALADHAVRQGVGIGLYPRFACAPELEAGRLVRVLEADRVDVGAVWLVVPTQQVLSARVRAFVELAEARLGVEPPWADGDS